jgi:hypothetical protein
VREWDSYNKKWMSTVEQTVFKAVPGTCVSTGSRMPCTTVQGPLMDVRGSNGEWLGWTA